jgi:putative transposase
LRKYNLSPTVFRRWKDNFNESGVATNLQSYAKLRNPEVDALEEQILVLKKIVAKQQIELEFKTELLKKSQSLEQRQLK